MSDVSLTELGKDAVHIWFAFPKDIQTPALLQRYHQLLNHEEAVQQKRFHFERHRHAYLVTRALVRTTLSRYARVRPQDWVFEKNQYGRPEIARNHENVPPIHFNLSHTDGLIVCAVTHEREIGVDVEDIKRGGGLIDIADRYFSPHEVAELHTVPAANQESRFFDYWTLKESYIKARGMGLSIPLGDFSFHIGDHQEISISIAPGQQDPPERWLFAHWFSPPQFKIALSLERLRDTKVDVVLRQVVPMAHDQPIDCTLLRSNFLPT